jgi:hypothetical protein
MSKSDTIVTIDQNDFIEQLEFGRYKCNNKKIIISSILIVIILITIISIVLSKIWSDNSKVSYVCGKTSDDLIYNTSLLWSNNWDNTYRTMTIATEKDPYDECTEFRGDGLCTIDDYKMILSGRQPRLYIDMDKQNVEVEGYFMREGNDGENWSGMNCGVRSHSEGHSTKPDRAHTYYFRMMHDNTIDLNRELNHDDGTEVLIKLGYTWERDIWYKYKFRCYNKVNDTVKLEGYINDKLVIEYEDCHPEMYKASGVVFIRNTEIDSAKYKNFTIKEIVKN